jgi:hypothetical protein
MKQSLFVFVFFILMTGCEKSIEFDLKESRSVLSVDASIETGVDPVVILTKSLNYFSKITPEILSNSVVKDAVIRISDGEKTQVLRRFDVLLEGNIPFSFYSSDPASPQTRITGTEGKTYRMEIEWSGQTFLSSTTIPVAAKTVDSVWWERVPTLPDTSKKVILKARVTDPPGFGNYIRYFTRVNNGSFFPGINSVFDDLLINGITYDISVDRGVDRNADVNFDEYGYFRKGDTVTLKFCNIDKSTFDFWRTTEFSYQSIGNPFSSPTKIQGNISNGALGYFGGYAVRNRTLIIPQ